jgi:hypothetical protein
MSAWRRMRSNVARSAGTDGEVGSGRESERLLARGGTESSLTDVAAGERKPLPG